VARIEPTTKEINRAVLSGQKMAIMLPPNIRQKRKTQCP
jgi:hypothetical protein